MGQALYRKYRPRSYVDLAGQEHITKTLRRALKSQQISHAYLFTGPKGVGKTSVARILAHEINGLKYDDDSAHIDIIEIDAASNRRIDEIRELREKVYMAPVQAKYKVYIIDEVHMLTKEAFNALLKTLEEPPAHVVFILATTDAHKLPETIISRTQRFSFKPITNEEIVSYLKRIAKSEKLSIDEEALKLIAEHGQGSLRDSVSILDQARSHSSKIDAATVTELLGLPSISEINEIFDLSINQSDISLLATKLNDLFDKGFQADTLASQLSLIIRQKVINSSNIANKDALLDLLKELIEVPSSFNPERYLEITLFKYQPESPVKEVVTNDQTAEPEVKEPNKDQPKVVKVPAPAEAVKPISVKIKPLDEKLWSEILNSLKSRHNTLYGVVRMAQPDFSEAGKLNLSFAFEFHKKKLSETSNKAILSSVIKELSGKDIVIECLLDKTAQPLKTESPEVSTPPESGDLSTISSIFNGAELLES